MSPVIAAEAGQTQVLLDVCSFLTLGDDVVDSQLMKRARTTTDRASLAISYLEVVLDLLLSLAVEGRSHDGLRVGGRASCWLLRD